MKPALYSICFLAVLFRLMAVSVRRKIHGERCKEHADTLPSGICSDMTVSFFRPVARNGVRRRLPNRKAGAVK
jgi:hypothetical protein